MKVSISFLGEEVTESTTLWNGEARARVIILGLALVGVAVSLLPLLKKEMAAMLMKATMAVALVNAVVIVLYTMAERSDAKDLGVDFSFGIAYFLSLLVMIIATVVAGYLGFMNKSEVAAK
ncbi:MAG: hypothetical protein Q9M91_03765 [Candidatus Dojkabacteria bacterium]|nr:hypothetical protein [Candidatus Dojkabacteria bacterium]MDQ7020930.1 hypothetical protein [Candidatus Dojkabacteria bacterium]